jgi:Ca2+-dependent lipid-binding protein
VKLNNVEYAMQRLDKLEQEMEVDRCAEIIRAREGPDPRSRGMKRGNKMERYVFTIKIIEAEDLKACDMNGLSDPYVVLGDEFQKRLAKTRIVYGSLNPRWDETVDIVTQGPLNIIATIWDWDQLGDHDCVGRTSLKLDPSHFWDFTPREYWLDLDTQGRLLLRVSMEGERDDIQFHFGKAFRSLKRTERDMARTITDKVSLRF